MKRSRVVVNAFIAGSGCLLLFEMIFSQTGMIRDVIGKQTEEISALAEQEKTMSINATSSVPLVNRSDTEFSTGVDDRISSSTGEGRVPSSSSVTRTVRSGKSFYKCQDETGRMHELPKFPSFIIAGTQKGGTTALRRILENHPDVLKPRPGEAHFFDSDSVIRTMENIKASIFRERSINSSLVSSSQLNHNRTNNKLTPGDSRLTKHPKICSVRRTYLTNHFNLNKIRNQPNKLTYEKTPKYIVDINAAEYIKATAPWAKIIIVLRHPVDRAFSAFRMTNARMRGDSKKISFEQFLALDLQLLRRNNFTVPANDPFPKRDLPSKSSDKMIYRGLYSYQLKPWLERYSLGGNLLVLQFEEFNNNPIFVLQQIYDFLQIRNYTMSQEKVSEKHNSFDSKTRVELRNETRAYLQKLYEPYNEELAKMLGDDKWRQVFNGPSYY